MTKLKHASFYKTNRQYKRAKEDLMIIAKRFVNGEVREAIEKYEHQDPREKRCVNVNLPWEAYEDKNNFISLCQGILKPLGFKSSESNDGVGISATLFVEW